MEFAKAPGPKHPVMRMPHVWGTRQDIALVAPLTLTARHGRSPRRHVERGA